MRHLIYCGLLRWFWEEVEDEEYSATVLGDGVTRSFFFFCGPMRIWHRHSKSFACPVLWLTLLCCSTISVNDIAASKRCSCPSRVWGGGTDVELVSSVVRQRFGHD